MPETRYEQGAIGTAPEPPIIALPYRSGSMDLAASICYASGNSNSTSTLLKTRLSFVSCWLSGHHLTLLSQDEQA